MHRLPHRARLHLGGIEPHTHRLHIRIRLAIGGGGRSRVNHARSTAHSARNHHLIRIFLTLHVQRRSKHDGAQPIVGIVVATFRLSVHRDAIHIRQQLLIERLHMLMVRNMLIHNRHLTTTNACTHIAHSIIIADFLVLIIRITLAILRGIHHHLAPSLVGRRNQRTATAGGNHLIAIKTQHTVAAKRAQHTPLIARAKALGSILNHRNIVAIGNLHNAIAIVGHAIERHRNNRLRLTPRDGNSILNSRLQQVRVHIPSVGLRIHKHRRGAKVSDRMRRCAKREALHYHLIAGTHTASHQRQMHGSRAGRQSHHTLTGNPIRKPLGVGFIDKRLQILLKSIHIRAQRHHPIRIKSLLNILLLHPGLRHMSQTQINPIS